MSGDLRQAERLELLGQLITDIELTDYCQCDVCGRGQAEQRQSTVTDQISPGTGDVSVCEGEQISSCNSDPSAEAPAATTARATEATPLVNPGVQSASARADDATEPALCKTKIKAAMLDLACMNHVRRPIRTIDEFRTYSYRRPSGKRAATPLRMIVLENAMSKKIEMAYGYFETEAETALSENLEFEEEVDAESEFSPDPDLLGGIRV